MSGILPCYGTYDVAQEECRRCRVRRYCRSFAENDSRGDLGEKKSDVPVEVCAALSRFATLPEIYETPDGKVGLTWNLLSRAFAFFLSLSRKAQERVLLEIKTLGMTKKMAVSALEISESYDRKIKKEIQTKMTASHRFRVFISGPMSGLPDFNRPAFHSAEEELTSRCIESVNPAYLGLWLDDGAPHDMFLAVSLAVIPYCAALIQLPGWRKSAGARAEHACALAHGLPVFSLEDLATGKLEKFRHKWERETAAAEEAEGK